MRVHVCLYLVGPTCNNNANVSTPQGSVLGLRIEWNCDLDRNYDNCKPRYSARRLDDRNAQVSPGFNFRYNSILTSTHMDCLKTGLPTLG